MKIPTMRRAALLTLAAILAALAAGCGSSKSTAANATDRAFVQQMIPHHMMAVQMAQSASTQAQHPQVRTLAANITTTQNREIAEMKPLASKLSVTPDQMPMNGNMTGGNMMGDAHALGISMDQMGMSMNMSALNGAKPFDRAFIDMMIPHHQGAIRMARAELTKGSDSQLQAIAKGIIADQTKEIGEMNTWRTQWFGRPSPAGGVPSA